MALIPSDTPKLVVPVTQPLSFLPAVSVCIAAAPHGCGTEDGRPNSANHGDDAADSLFTPNAQPDTAPADDREGGGAVYLCGQSVTTREKIDATGGVHGRGGYNFGSGALGGLGQEGGQKGREGGKGGTGGRVGQGSKGFVYVGSALPANTNGQLLGAVHTGSP